MWVAMIRYEWTGEYRPPKKGDWFLDVNHFACGYMEPMRLKEEGEKVMRPCWILRRIETEEGEK